MTSKIRVVVEASEPDLDLVLDFRFMEIEAELSVIVNHAESIERQLAMVIEDEREKLEGELTRADQDEYYGMLHWIDEIRGRSAAATLSFAGSGTPMGSI